MHERTVPEQSAFANHPTLTRSFCANIRVQTHCRCRVESSCDQDCNNETVDCDNTGHDDGNERLYSGFGLARVRMRKQSTRVLAFMMRSGRKVPTPAIPMPALAVPYAAPAPVKL